eukprot:CAMPEP_0195520332 /NCGR_PEP_ID=MMETSP0794_2-20130614/16644_1 /TAXON_ID=515487 /ORGANISM="Stephanopyxis turris, Strain CCMP 815" /LENGTH=322 /DNA_ID=CAMNT_0040649667 /DNA_START=89 /DNA_END=1057 /DNA_ORIENTATION=+
MKSFASRVNSNATASTLNSSVDHNPIGSLDEQDNQATNLEWELDKLRESTRDALEVSWGEVERLQGDSVAHADTVDKLKSQLRSLEMEMAERNSNALSGLVCSPEVGNGSHQGSKLFTTLNPSGIDLPIATVQSESTNVGFSDHFDQETVGSKNSADKKSVLSQTSTRFQNSVFGKIRNKIARPANPMEEELMRQLASLERDKKETISDLENVLLTKKKFISTLEHRVEAQNETIEELRKELEELRKSFAEDREDGDEEISMLRNQIRDLKNSLELKDSQVSQVLDAIEQKKNSISLLTNELSMVEGQLLSFAPASVHEVGL